MIWAFNQHPRLSQVHATIIADGEQCWVSIASLWEISIKRSIGKLNFSDDIVDALRQGHIEILPISLAHAEAIRTLPHHHRDPFDRMLIAQAMTEDLTILTADRNIPLYAVTLA